MQYLSQHRKECYLYAGIAVAVIVIFIGWYFYQLHYESRAEAMYSSAYSSYTLTTDVAKEKDTLTKAVDLYKELVEAYPSSRAAGLAYYNLGNLYFSLGDIDASIEAYTLFLDKSSDKGMLTALAYYGLGYCYEAQKDYEQALRSFENSESHSVGKNLKTINYSNIARIYEKMNNYPKAIEYYKKVIENKVEPFMEGMIKNKIASLS